MGSSKASWSLLFGLDHINKYLEKHDLKQLCSANTHIRNKLKSKLYYNINLLKCPPNSDIYLYPNIKGEKAINEKIGEFVDEISSIAQYVKEFCCGETTNMYLLNPIFSVFTQLKYVWLHFIFIPTPTLKKILENLNLVESLEFTRVTAVEWGNNLVCINSIELPKTLKKLTIQSCNVLENELEEDPMLYDFEIWQDTYESGKLFLFKDVVLPNLEYISLTRYEEPNIHKINSFLSSTINLKSLKIDGSFINQNTINILKSLNSFEELDLIQGIIPFGDENDSLQLDFSNLSQLKTISIICKNSYDMFKNYITMFSNLSKLKVYYNTEIIDYILNSVNLKELTIFCDFSDDFKYNFPPNNLEVIEIICFDPKNINFNSLASCGNLKVIKIKPMKGRVRNITLPQLWKYYSKFEGWRCKISSSSISCHRIHRNNKNS
jgi:hypothetical protein